MSRQQSPKTASDLSGCTILVVDDIEVNVELMEAILGNFYHLAVAYNGKMALDMVGSVRPDLILLDVMMPNMDGYEVCRRLKANKGTQDIPIIFITALGEEGDETKGLELGAVDYITKPFKPVIVKNRIRNQLELKRHRDELEKLVQERTQELALSQEVAFESLATLAEYRDPETGGHIRRTQYYVKILAEHLQDHPRFCNLLDDATVKSLWKSAPLHDIGKVGVPDRILLKNGKLTHEEFEEMKKHPIYGRDAIRASVKKIGSTPFLEIAQELIYSHHEKWDGSGYPERLKGDDIPVSGRIMAIVDVYDALISKRVYKPSFPHRKAVEIIMKSRETHFDPDIVDAFAELQNHLRKIALQNADHQEERENLSQELKSGSFSLIAPF
ncbi:two-component system response regulator [candidate division KSB3 bacterium]|uniref:Two-component system response regulator n=1 Tax=candidate division KSB3 bacterium TaxID=2044937 RepID=A0A2G6KFF9_9BACT|nr:MAG: two-component system response regulator [candidate division KSB3 bacterium]